ncbi:MAG: short-chain dehydrogenase/reductase [Nocardioides sp.]|uniref:SDR family NAD(P)-dependent oxidoreductase n=1 Tax=Nocardioides sp. TaxID=35761 RepID=UPI002624FF08|nr:SDR family NAD(P)-dependent oxidoreductase [Nocardioides sp.]MCW2833521.1 short-chain dehydrogenase/reductase [Nocardioides sp.]
MRILLTGAAGGIGGRIARRLAEQSHRVFTADRVLVAGFDGVVADLSEREGNRIAVDAAVESLGGLDAVIPSAGMQVLAPVDKFPEDDWDRLLAVMLTSPFLLAKYAWPHLAASQQGRFVAIASAHSHVAGPRKAAYVSAKHGVLGLVKVLAADGAADRIGAVAVCPGYVESPMTQRRVDDIRRLCQLDYAEAVRDFVAGTHLIPEMVPVDAVAECVELALGPSGLALTGGTLTPDLGWTAH